MAGIRQSILNFIPLLPNSFNRQLMQFTRNPVRVYGKQYAAYRFFLRVVEHAYDPVTNLLDTVNIAISRIPYYRQRYGGRRINSLAEFEDCIGFITRETILDDYKAFIAEGIGRSTYDQGTTGGARGRPLQLIAPHNLDVVEMATMHSLWERAGYRFDARAVIRNHRLDNGEVYRINPITREVIFDGFRLNDDYFARVYETINKLSIHFIHCYPSTAQAFATFLLEKRLDPSVIKAFLSGSENIFDYQRELIQGRLGIRFYNWYGHSEKLVLAGYCAESDLYHVEPTYGYFELVNGAGKVVREPGGVGEIVGTSLHNTGKPFIRYRTGDFAEYVGDYCSACNRYLPVIRNIRGRRNGDRIYKADGTFVTTTALNLHNDLSHVLNAIQYFQELKGELTVLIVKSPRYTSGHEADLYRHFGSKLGKDTIIKIRYVDRLLRQDNGKFDPIISSVDGKMATDMHITEGFIDEK